MRWGTTTTTLAAATLAVTGAMAENHAPLAVVHPSGEPDAVYEVAPGRDYVLDGMRSYDPDPSDWVVSYMWDTDGNGTFEAAGPQVPFTAPAGWGLGETHTGRFQVCDDGRWDGCEADCSLCTEVDVTFETVASARPVVLITTDAVTEGGLPIIALPEGGAEVVDASASYDPEGDGPLLFALECDPAITVEETVLPGWYMVHGEGAAAGAYACQLTATDVDEQWAARDLEVHVVHAAPVVEAGGTADSVEGAVVRLEAIVADPAGLSFDFDCESDGVWEVEGSAETFAECVYEDAGVYAWTVRVTDAQDAVAFAVSAPFGIADRPPAWTASLDELCGERVEGELAEIALPVADPGGDAVSCAATGPLPEGAALDGCTLSWSPTYAQALAGEVFFAVEAQDAGGLRIAGIFGCLVRIADHDDDGLPDTWESTHGVDDPAADPDADGLSNGDEYAGGHDPSIYDGPGMPTLLGPADGAIVDTETPTLIVGNTSDALASPLAYVFEVYGDVMQRDLVWVSDAQPGGPGETSVAIPAGRLEENRRYWWSARAVSPFVTGVDPFPSDFAVNAAPEAPAKPVILGPRGPQAEATVEVRLAGLHDPDPEAMVEAECQVEAGGEPAAVGWAAVRVDGGATLRLGPFAEDARLSLRCRGKDETGLAGDWEGPVAFRINAVESAPSALALVSPVGGARVRTETPTLTAGIATDAEGELLTYRFQIATDAAFADVVADSGAVDAADDTVAWAPVGPLADNRRYHWRAWASDGLLDGPAASAEMIVDQADEAPSTPAVVSPAPGAVIGTTEPEIVVGPARDPDPESAVSRECTIVDRRAPGPALVLATGDAANEPATLPAPALAENGLYRVSCRAIDDGGLASAPSADVDFRVDAVAEAPGAPVRLAPANDALVDAPALVVGPASDPEGEALVYVFEISTDPAFARVVETGEAHLDDDRAAYAPEALVENVRYWWRAVARDPGGLTGPAVEGRFVLDATAEPPGATEVLSPEDGERLATATPTIEVAAATDPDPGARVHHECELGDEAFEVVQRAPAGEPVAEPLPENTYTWVRCRAVDETRLAGPWTEPRRVFVNAVSEPPPAPTLQRPMAGERLFGADVSLVVSNVEDPDGDALAYGFALYSETGDVLASGLLPAGDDGTTTFTPEVWLADDARYRWSTWATDGEHEGPAAEAWFDVNATDDPPSAPTVRSPQVGEVLQVRIVRVLLEGGVDPDPAEILFHTCEVAPDPTFSGDVRTFESVGEPEMPVGLILPQLLPDETLFWTRCRSVDTTGLASPWSRPVGFRTNSGNDPPGAPVLLAPGDAADTRRPTFVIENAPDRDGDALTYTFEVADVPFDLAVTLIGLWEVPGDRDGRTTFVPPADLPDNRRLYWRVHARDGGAAGPAVEGTFVLDVANDAPTAIEILAPVDGTLLGERSPKLRMTGASDPDLGARLAYECLVTPGLDGGRTIVSAAPAGSPAVVEMGFDRPLPDDTAQTARCRARDERGLGGPWSAPVRFSVNVGNDAPTPTLLLLPVDGATARDVEVTLQAGGARDADGDSLTYVFEVSPDADFVDVAAHAEVPEADDHTATWETPALADNAVYYWRVWATDGQLAGADGRARFVLDREPEAPAAPEVGPIPGRVAEMPFAVAIAHATDPDPLDEVTVHCELRTGEAFDQVAGRYEARADARGHAELEIGGVLPENTRAALWCRTEDLAGELSKWTQSSPFTYDEVGDSPGAPELRWPADGDVIADLTPVLRLGNAIDPERDALTYEIQIARDEHFEDLVATAGSVPEGRGGETRFAPSEALADDAEYRWRARARDATGAGPWAEATFVVNTAEDAPETPRIASPEPGDRLTGPVPVAVVVDAHDADFGASLEIECEIGATQRFMPVVDRARRSEGRDGTTQVPFEVELTEDAAYWLRCRAWDDTDRASAWTEAVAFGIDGANAAPGMPAIVFPPPGATVDDALMTLVAGGAADPDGDAVTYRFEISTDPSFRGDAVVSDEIAPSNDGEARFPLPDVLAEDQTYYWRVRATDGGQAGPANQARFRVDAVDNAPGRPEPLGPVDGELTGERPTFTWSAVTDPEGEAVEYVIELWAGTPGGPPLWTRSTAHTWLEAPEALPPGRYTWSIAAYDPQGVWSASAAAKFEVEAPEVPVDFPEPPAPGTVDPEDAPPVLRRAAPSGCSTTGRGLPAPLAVLLVAGLALRRRRR